mmetsp:Transcript_66042/g.190573  ORF Transcript_66042/g.190573 Transcript_66042/m.190573 type:complete len:264 (-) Transcript_66042:90-881(-)
MRVCNSACELYRFVQPPFEGFERPLRLPQLLVLFELILHSSHVRPTAEPKSALLLADSLRNALVPQVIQRHSLATEFDVRGMAVVVGGESYVQRLVQVSEQIDQHLHGIGIGELDTLLHLAVVDGGIVDLAPLVGQDLAIKVLNGIEQADAVLAMCHTSFRRTAPWLAIPVVVHLEVQPGDAREGLVHLVPPTRNIRGVLAAEQALHLPRCLLVHGAGASLSDGVVGVDVERHRDRDTQRPQVQQARWPGIAPRAARSRLLAL